MSPRRPRHKAHLVAPRGRAAGLTLRLLTVSIHALCIPENSPFALSSLHLPSFLRTPGNSAPARPGTLTETMPSGPREIPPLNRGNVDVVEVGALGASAASVFARRGQRVLRLEMCGGLFFVRPSDPFPSAALRSAAAGVRCTQGFGATLRTECHVMAGTPRAAGITRIVREHGQTQTLRALRSCCTSSSHAHCD